MTTHLCEAVSKGEEFSTVEIKANDRKLPALSYAAQYCQLYYCRFKSFLPRLKAAAKTKWTIQSSNSCTFCERILDLEDQEESVIMGIVYVDSPAKPNVLADLEGELNLPPAVEPTTYLCEKNTIYLEDDSGRIEVTWGASHSFDWVTGCCLAIKGVELEDGRFFVRDICFPEICPAPSRSLIDVSPRYIAVVSGLNFGDPKMFEATDVLFDFLSGNIPGMSVCPISAVVFAGSVLGPHLSNHDEGKKHGHEGDCLGFANIKKLDMHLATLTQSLKLVVVPGASDPTGSYLPQSRFKEGLFPLTAKQETALFCSNPSSFRIEGTDFLISGGQNIDNMCRYSQSSNRLDLLELSLRCGHLAPSAPDTLCTKGSKLCTLTDRVLGTLPFIEDDPFIIHNLPNCYIVGNQPYFDSRWLQENGKINSKLGQLMLPNLHRGQDGSLPKIFELSSSGFSEPAQSRLLSYRAHVSSEVKIISIKKASLHHYIHIRYMESSSLRI